MSRLNAIIKLLFCCGELVFVFASLVCLVASGLVAMGRVGALSFPAAKETATLVLLLAGMVFVCTCFGCVGAIRQTLRRGCWSGRRMLCLHQLVILMVLAFAMTNASWLDKREQSLKLVLSNHTAYQYDAFERRISTYFNNAYFDSLCSDDPSSTAFFSFIDRKCPERMTQKYCTLPAKKKIQCDTSCAIKQDTLDSTTFDTICPCPGEELCNDGFLASCPYEKCRVGILEELHRWAAPTIVVARLVTFLLVLMLVLSCLLICYNPRDEIEVELLKTGVMSADDVEAIKLLKKSRNVVINRDSKIDAESLDMIKKSQKEKKFGGFRKRLDRVSPTGSPLNVEIDAHYA